MSMVLVAVLTSSFMWSFLLGHAQGPGRGGDQERGERGADLAIGTETEVDAEVAHALEADEEAVLEIADAVDPETEIEGITEVDLEKESAQALERGEGHVQEKVEGDHDLETGREVVQGNGDDQDRGRERGRGHHLGTGSSEEAAILGRRETNSTH